MSYQVGQESNVLRKNILRGKLDKNEPTISTRIINKWPGMMEIIGHCGQVDYVEFLGEYVSYDLEDIDNLARASEVVNVGTMIKIDQPGQRFVAQRAIGSGIQSVLFTDIRTVEDAQECVHIVRAETPETKGINPCTMRRNVGYLLEPGTSKYVQSLNEVVIAIMIEKKSAVDNLKEILKVEGIDMVQFGPCDYSMSIGIPGQTGHAKVRDAEKKVIETALEMGVIPRAEINDIRDAQRYIDMGVRHFSLGIDIIIVFNWLKENSALLRDML